MNDKFLMHFDPKQESGRRVPAALAALAAAGKATIQYVLLFEVDESVAEAARIILTAQGVEIEPWPVLMGVDMAVTESNGVSPEPKQKEKAHEARACIICGEAFQPKRHDQVLCGKPECKKARQRWYLTGKTGQSANDEPATEEAEPPFVEKDPRAIWTVKDSSLAPMTMKELQDHLIEKTIKPGTVLIRMNSSFPWIVYEDETGLHLREVEDLAQGSETTR